MKGLFGFPQANASTPNFLTSSSMFLSQRFRPHGDVCVRSRDGGSGQLGEQCERIAYLKISETTTKLEIQ